MNSSLNFYSSQGPISDPGPYAYLFDGLPTDIGELCKIVQGLIIHVFWADRYGRKLSNIYEEQVLFERTMQRQLARMLELDPRPLTEARPLDRKLIGNCRDFTQFLVAILRHQGVPARARCGFGAYFIPDHYEDHWVAEYWDAAQGRWKLVDAQLDTYQQGVLHTPFDTLDVPRDQFVVGGMAWQMARGGGAKPEAFGIADMHGLWFILGDFIRDVAALNKAELLAWDCWGVMDIFERLIPNDFAYFDRLAELTSGDVPDFDAVHALYEGDARLRFDGTVRSYLGGNPKEIVVI
jgi:hypothetical protein